MPMPKPGKKDSKEEFVARFMGDAAMVKEYPDQKQRYAICMSQWKQKMANNAREAFRTNHPGHGDQKVHDPHKGGKGAAGGGDWWNRGEGTGEVKVGGKGRFPDTIDTKTGKVDMTGEFSITDTKSGLFKLKYKDGSEGWLPEKSLKGYMEGRAKKVFDPTTEAPGPGGMFGDGRRTRWLSII